MGVRYVAFLRAINIGDRRVKMDRLREVFAVAGHPDARTHLATGNVVFDAAAPPDLPALEDEIEAGLGFRSEVFLRSTPEIEYLMDAVPWRGEGDMVEVSFLDRMPDGDAARELEGSAVPPERLLVVKDAVLFRSDRGRTATVHKERHTERILGALTTRRGMATVETIHQRFLRA